MKKILLEIKNKRSKTNLKKQKNNIALDVKKEIKKVCRKTKIPFSRKAYNKFKDKITATREKYQTNLTQMANHNCKKCFGRGYLGFDIANVAVVACNCINKKYETKTKKTTKTIFV